jgi:D-glycero-alpha-D-manno-heptose 1-phosphate guanylyltransferase
MKLLVLAGGFGTRLKSVVTDVPKALAPVGGVTFLYLQIEHWVSQGINSFVFLLHHQADLIVDFIKIEKDGLFKGCDVQWIIEPTPMDTGGALAHAIQQLNISGDFMVSNADTWLGAGISEVRQENSPSIAVLNVPDASRYGSVKFNEGGIITAFIEKSDLVGGGWINAGLSHLHTDLFKDWDRQPFSLERDKFPLWVSQGILKAVPLEFSFIDIGIPDDYFRFCRWIELKKVGML